MAKLENPPIVRKNCVAYPRRARSSASPTDVRTSPGRLARRSVDGPEAVTDPPGSPWARVNEEPTGIRELLLSGSSDGGDFLCGSLWYSSVHPPQDSSLQYFNGIEADLWTSFGKVKQKEILVLRLVDLYRTGGLSAGLLDQRKSSAGAKLRSKTLMYSPIQAFLTGW